MISVIIPVYNEERVIGNTVRYLQSIFNERIREIIVVDAGSTDNSLYEAREEGAVVIQSALKGRAAQMNAGAKASSGSLLYFLHADSLPPKSFITDITEAVDQGFPVGCYRLRFDLDHWFLNANTWFTRFDVNAFRYGDQSLFVTREVFNHIGGFCEKHTIMEDYEFIRRVRKSGRFKIIPKEITTSARKYVSNGIYKTQIIFYMIYFMYRLGYTQDKLLATFRRLIQQDKV